MFFWIYDLPNWQGAVLFTSVITIFTLPGVIATRRTVQRLVRTQSG